MFTKFNPFAKKFNGFDVVVGTILAVMIIVITFMMFNKSADAKPKDTVIGTTEDAIEYTVVKSTADKVAEIIQIIRNGDTGPVLDYHTYPEG